MYTNVAIATFFAGLAAAQIHAPVGEPTGNPITSPLNEVVPKCEPFTIKWTPTTTNTISLLLLKGPSSNVVKYGPALAEGIANSGSFVWTPASDLPTTDGPTGYGLQLIDDVTGQYQYSTQIGIGAGNCKDTTSSSSSAVVASSSSLAPAASSVAGYSMAASSSAAGGYPVASATPVAPVSSYATAAPYPTTMVSSPSSAVYNSTVKPTGYTTGNTTTTSKLPEQTTNAAAGLSAGLGLAGAAAFAALML